MSFATKIKRVTRKKFVLHILRHYLKTSTDLLNGKTQLNCTYRIVQGQLKQTMILFAI
jgi:hypothetical protein